MLMGLWKEIKKEWTWDNIMKSWPDYVAIFIAASVASEYCRSFWMFIPVWLIVFFISRFLILYITKLIKKKTI